MPDKTSYDPGEPIWVDLATPDRDASIAFYGALLGWTADEANEEFGGYTTLRLGGKQVAGLMPLMQEGQPPVWTTYLCTDDSEKTSAAISAAGGTVHAPTMDVGDLGRMAIYADPSGAFFGTWQPGTHTGTEVVGVAGSPAWAELSTRDKAAAVPFYTSVFGLQPHVSPEYTELQIGGRSVAGVMDMPEMVPAEVPSFWMPYFLVDDPAAKAQEAAALGAEVRVPLMEMDDLAFSVVSDPHGSTFGLLHTKG